MSLDFIEDRKDTVVKEEYATEEYSYSDFGPFEKHIPDVQPLTTDQTSLSNTVQVNLPPIKTEPPDEAEIDYDLYDGEVCVSAFCETQLRDLHPLPKIETLEPDTFRCEMPQLKSEPPEDNDTLLQNAEKGDEFAGNKDSINFTDDAPYEDCHPSYEEMPDSKLPVNGLVGDEDEIQDDSSKSQSWRSKQSDRNRKTFCCYSCGLIFVVLESYQRHYRNEHPDMIQSDDCYQHSCEQISFVPIVPKEMSCKYCLKSFTDPTAYHRHMENAHPEKLFICPHCPKTFREKIKRNYHIDAHEGRTPYTCAQCPKMYSDPYNLKEHAKTHSSVKQFACQFCDYTCLRNVHLKRHELIHTNETPYQCNECDAKFRDEKLLDLHIRKHMNIRNFKCPKCEKAFTCSKYLKAHLETHEKDRSFSCEVCDETFAVKRYLRIHQQSHNKTFECEICGKYLKQRKSLLQHYRKVHKSSLIKK